MKKNTETYGSRIYKFENANGESIYVGRTIRPLTRRVKEHKVEKLMSEVAKIYYIELPNEAQMIQYEDYYINLYKPKYNLLNKGEGIPVPLPEYQWILYEEFNERINFSAYNLKILETMFNIFNDELFDGKILAYPTYTNKDISTFNGFKLDKHKKTFYGGVDKYPITIPETEVLNNSEMVPLMMLTQMILVWGEQNNVKVHSGYYKNKRFFNKGQEVGVIIKLKNDDGKADKYGVVPVGLSDDVKKLIDGLGFDEAEVYYLKTKTTKSNSVKYYDDYGVIVRGTTHPNTDAKHQKKNGYHILFALDHDPALAEEIERKYGLHRMQIEDPWGK